jgi:hypothetical protein
MIRRGRRSPEFATWLAIQLRGRVCERWRSFGQFYADVGKRPTWRHSCDPQRYQPPVRAGQCRVATCFAVSMAATNDLVRTRKGLIQINAAASLPPKNYACGCRI